MPKQALILDLDNTIYPVVSIGDELFKPLFQLITQSGEYEGDFEAIKKDIMRKPFQKVAAEFNFSGKLANKGIELLRNLTYEKQMFPFEDYVVVKKLKLKKFLVTTGFIKMQQSKVKQLHIENDFEEIHIVDPDTSTLTKKDFFKDILEGQKLNIPDVLVVGDDINSEIQAAKECGIDWVLYDKLNFHPNINLSNKIYDYRDLAAFI